MTSTVRFAYPWGKVFLIAAMNRVTQGDRVEIEVKDIQ
jgi:hypothetical protein